jgi:uncharacterized Fe-S cluster-containing MiaB family protein
MDIMKEIYEKAKTDKKKIILPESSDIRTLKAAIKTRGCRWNRCRGCKLHCKYIKTGT